MGLATGALFLSLRYHRLHPEYIHARIQKLAHMYTLRVLLVLCDVNDHQPAIKELTKVALVNRMALIVAWSPEEAARYLETYKAFEHKPPDLLRSRVADDYMSQLTSVLTNVRGINKTDVLTLASRLGVRNYARVHCMLTLQSISDVADAPHDTLMMLPGMGDVKARYLVEAFQQPLRLHGSAGGEPGLPAARPPSQAAQAAARPHSEQDQPREHSEPPHAGPQEPVAADTSTSEPPLQSLPEGFEELPEEEQLRLALQMSVGE